MARSWSAVHALSMRPVLVPARPCGGSGDAHWCRRFRTASMNACTRSLATGLVMTSACLKAVPTMSPSATSRTAATFIRSSPLPANTGAPPAAPLAVRRSSSAVCLPLAEPVTMIASAAITFAAIASPLTTRLDGHADRDLVTRARIETLRTTRRQAMEELRIEVDKGGGRLDTLQGMIERHIEAAPELTAQRRHERHGVRRHLSRIEWNIAEILDHQSISAAAGQCLGVPQYPIDDGVEIELVLRRAGQRRHVQHPDYGFPDIEHIRQLHRSPEL